MAIKPETQTERNMNRRMKDLEKRMDNASSIDEYNHLYDQYVRLDMEMEDSFYSRHYREEEE